MKGVNAGKNNGMYGKTPKNTKRIKVYSEKHTKNKIFFVKSSYEKKIVDDINNNNSINFFTYEPSK